MSLVLAIDPGLRNLAFCVMNEKGEVLHIHKDDIFHGATIVLADVFYKIYDWCHTHKNLFDECDNVVCEKQFADAKLVLSSSLLIVETVIHCFAKSKFLSVHAMSVKRAYSTYTGEYRKNKTMAIQRAQSICPTLFLSTNDTKKIDDMCDAFLLAHYYTFHLSQHMRISRAETKEGHNNHDHDDEN
jgi:Holliday junction resolvasome RuvABC endonuclease subunit